MTWTPSTHPAPPSLQRRKSPHITKICVTSASEGNTGSYVRAAVARETSLGCAMSSDKYAADTLNDQKGDTAASRSV